MTQRTPTGWATPPQVSDEPPEKRRRHIFLWIFLAIQLVFVVWIAVGAHSAQQTSCSGLSAQDCANAKEVGTTIGVGLIIGLWAVVDIIVGGTYAVYRLVKR